MINVDVILRRSRRILPWTSKARSFAGAQDDSVKTLMFAVVCLLLSALPLNAAPTILLSSPSVYPGQTLRVEVDGMAPNEQTRLAFTKGFFPLFEIGPDAQRGLIGIRLDAAPGPYTLKLQHYV